MVIQSLYGFREHDMGHLQHIELTTWKRIHMSNLETESIFK